MTQKTKLVLCLALMLLAAVSLAAVLGSLGVLPVGAVEDDDGVLLREVGGRGGALAHHGHPRGQPAPGGSACPDRGGAGVGSGRRGAAPGGLRGVVPSCVSVGKMVQ